MNWIALAICVFVWAEAIAMPFALIFSVEKSKEKPWIVGISTLIIAVCCAANIIMNIIFV